MPTTQSQIEDCSRLGHRPENSGRREVRRAIADCETRRGPQRDWDGRVHKLTAKFRIDEASTDMTAQIATGPAVCNDRRRPVNRRVNWCDGWKISRHGGHSEQRRESNSCSEEFSHDPPPGSIASVHSLHTVFLPSSIGWQLNEPVNTRADRTGQIASRCCLSATERGDVGLRRAGAPRRESGDGLRIGMRAAAASENSPALISLSRVRATSMIGTKKRPCESWCRTGR